MLSVFQESALFTTWIFILVEKTITQTNSSSPNWKAESYWFGMVSPRPCSSCCFPVISLLMTPFIAALQTHILISSDHSTLFHHENMENWTHWNFFSTDWWPFLFLWCPQCQNASASIFINKMQTSQGANTRDIWGGEADMLSAFFFSPRVPNSDRHL